MNQNYNYDNEIYSTTDLALATTLSLFHPLSNIDKTNPHKAQFLFKRGENLDELIKKYWRGELRVDPQAYFNQLKVIKARLYSSEHV